MTGAWPDETLSMMEQVLGVLFGHHTDRVTNMCEWIYYARTGERLEMNQNHRL